MKEKYQSNMEIRAIAIVMAAALIAVYPLAGAAEAKDATAATAAEACGGADTCDNHAGASHMVVAKKHACQDGLNQERDNNYWSNKTDCFRAAVVDYSPYLQSDNCTICAEENLAVYEKIARVAAENGAQILVFPENGILFGLGDMRPCFEEIPNPMQTTDYNPCLQPNRYEANKFPILTRLSCLARENGLYIVANYGTKERRKECQENVDCEDATQIKGAFGKYLMLNTNVVFDPTGLFIRRYRKWHPFVPAESFAKAPELEHVYFDTEFGRFGVFTCFDILYKQPAIDLVEKFNIDSVVFPTQWLDEVPLLTAVQIQDSWSAANRVNLLASNILNSPYGATGSGIYSCNGSSASLYVPPFSFNYESGLSKTKILISTVPARKQGISCQAEAKPKIIELDDNPGSTLKYEALDYPIQAGDTIESLDGLAGKKLLCAGQVCCEVDYELEPRRNGELYLNRIVIVVRDSLRLGGWYEQVCTMATLNKSYPAHELPTQGATGPLDSSFLPVANFRRLSIRAEFDTEYVFPMGGHSLRHLVKRDRRQMSCRTTTNSVKKQRHACELQYVPVDAASSARAGDLEPNRLYSFGMYGRVYERDREELMGEPNVSDHVVGFLVGRHLKKLRGDYTNYIYYGWFVCAIVMFCFLIKVLCWWRDSRQVVQPSHQTEYGTSNIARRLVSRSQE